MSTKKLMKRWTYDLESINRCKGISEIRSREPLIILEIRLAIELDQQFDDLTKRTTQSVHRESGGEAFTNC